MVVLNLVLAVSISAAAYQGPDPARLLLLDASACKFVITQKALSTDAADIAKFDDDRKKSLADLEEHAPAAIGSAGSSQELEAAIKSFYAAADGYCKSPSSAGGSEYKTRAKALDALLQSAGR